MKLNSLEDTFNLSKKIGKLLSKGDVVFLYGEIGVGKTTFVRGLINNLEVEKGMDKSQILSPTFNIVFDYEIKKLKIMHYISPNALPLISRSGYFNSKQLGSIEG